MRFAILALLGLATAEESFMQDPVMDETELMIIGSGSCVNWNIQKNLFFDLKKFDGGHREKGKAAVQKFPGGDKFLYKPCQPKFKLDED